MNKDKILIACNDNISTTLQYIKSRGHDYDEVRNMDTSDDDMNSSYDAGYIAGIESVLNLLNK